MVKILVKWNKEKYDLEVDLGQSVDELKALIYSLTNVPIDK